MSKTFLDSRNKLMSILTHRLRSLPVGKKRDELEVEIDFINAYYVFLEYPEIELAMKGLKLRKDALDALTEFYTIAKTFTKEGLAEICMDSLATISKYLINNERVWE